VNGFVEERSDIGSIVEEAMETLISVLYLIAGLLLRLAIPILGTVLLIVYLRKLDQRWQAEAELPPRGLQKPECWKIQGCTSQQIENCEASKAELPCWQVYRLPNGYLHEECLSCQVFTEAPIPTLKPEARRM
jgi:hypothetical protein